MTRKFYDEQFRRLMRLYGVRPDKSGVFNGGEVLTALHRVFGRVWFLGCQEFKSTLGSTFYQWTVRYNISKPYVSANQ